MLNSVWQCLVRVQPSDKGRRLKIYYAQVTSGHPTLSCSATTAACSTSLPAVSGEHLRNTFGLEGTPICLSIRQRGEKEG
ncbi:MAG: hypothetical protein ACLR7Y_04710 [Dysosmobacter sp.]